MTENTTPVVVAPPMPTKTVRTVLSVVNPVRQAFGMSPLDDLPFGDRGEPASCAIAEALGGQEGPLNPDVSGSNFGLKDRTQANKAVAALKREGIDAEAIGSGGGIQITDDKVAEAMDDFVDRFDRGAPHYGRYGNPDTN